MPEVRLAVRRQRSISSIGTLFSSPTLSTAPAPPWTPRITSGSSCECRRPHGKDCLKHNISSHRPATAHNHIRQLLRPQKAFCLRSAFFPVVYL